MVCLKKFFVSACLFLAGGAFAASAYPGFLESTQPDGSVVKIRNVGNGNLHYTLSEEGDLIVRDSTGFWNYSDESGKSTGVKFRKKGDRDKSEREFLQKHDSKRVLEKFLDKKNRESRGRNPMRRPVKPATTEDEAVSQPAVFRAAPVTNLKQAVKILSRPSFDANLTTGEIRGLVILVEFPDVAFKTSTRQDDYQKFMNEEGYSENGMRWSVRDYYISNSMGAFVPTFDVAAPVTLPNNRAYYGTQQYANEAFTDAINALVARGDIDFSKYDNDGDRYVDFVYMIYAGVGSADTDVSDAIWPQSFWADPIRVAGSGWHNALYVSHYACSNEISGTAYMYNKNTTTLAGMGMFVHEFGHVLGLPDFYDTQDADNKNTPGVWDLMDMGEYNSYSGYYSLPGTAPPRLTAFERYSIGWLTPRVLAKENGEITIRGIDQNDAVFIPTDDPDDYFVLDYRAKYDTIAPLPSSGLLVWRVHFDSTAWYQNTVNLGDNHMFWLFRADGSPTFNQNSLSLEDKLLKGDPFPGYKKVMDFEGFVTYAGDSLGLKISEIAESDSAVTFRVKWAGVEDVSSSSVASSSSAASSSSSESPASSSATASWSSSAIAVITSSTTALPEGALRAFSMRAEGSVLHVEVPFSGTKEVRVFDLQGHVLYTQKIEGEYAAIGLERLGHGAFVARLTANRQVLGVKKLQLE